MPRSKKSDTLEINYPAGLVRDEVTDFGTCNGCGDRNVVLHKIGETAPFVWRCDKCVRVEDA